LTLGEPPSKHILVNIVEAIEDGERGGAYESYGRMRE
jgi:hypothetical protein